MTTNFMRHQEGEGPENEVSYNPIRIGGTTTRFSTIDGIVTEDSTSIERGDSNTNPYAGTASIFSTARQPNGMAATELRPDTLIEIDGVQASISFWMAEGRIAKAADGSYTEGNGAPEETPKGAPEGFSPLSEESMARVNAALDPVAQEDLDGLASTAVAVGLGKFSAEALVSKFSTASGQDPEEARASVSAIIGEYQAHADQVLAGSGIEASDLQAFYQWARTTKPTALQEAMGLHFHAADVQGYRKLAAQWLSSTPPSIATLKAAGIPTRKQGQGTEAFVKGSWMSLGAAAKAGLI